MIRAAGARMLFLPPYSPDLNPIEQVFAKLKHRMRDAAQRTVENTWRRLGALLQTFPPNECANYLANSGLDSATPENACLMTFGATEGRRNRWERVAALWSAARDGSGVR